MALRPGLMTGPLLKQGYCLFFQIYQLGATQTQ